MQILQTFVIYNTCTLCCSNVAPEGAYFRALNGAVVGVTNT